MNLSHGERYGSLTVISDPIKTKHGTKYRVGCGTCGCQTQLVRARRFNRGQEKCCRCAKREICANHLAKGEKSGTDN